MTDRVLTRPLAFTRSGHLYVRFYGRACHRVALANLTFLKNVQTRWKYANGNRRIECLACLMSGLVP